MKTCEFLMRDGSVFRLIFRQGKKYKDINLTDTTLPKIVNLIETLSLCVEILPIFRTPQKTNVTIQKCAGGVFTDCKNMDVAGFTPTVLKQVMIKYIKNEN